MSVSFGTAAFGWAAQSDAATFATAPATTPPSSFYALEGGDSIDVKKEIKDMGSIYHTMSTIDHTQQTKSWVEGSFKLPLWAEGLEAWFRRAWGVTSTSTLNTAGSYKHEFRLGSTLIGSTPGIPLTLFRNLGSTSESFRMMKPTAIKFEWQKNERASVEFDVFGRSHQIITSPTYTFPASTVPILDAATPSGTTVSYNGATLGNVEAFRCTMSSPLDTDASFILADTTPREPDRSGPFEVTGEFDVLFNDVDGTSEPWQDSFTAVSSATRALIFKVEGATISGTSDKYTFAIECDKIFVTDVSPHMEAAGRIRVTVAWKAYIQESTADQTSSTNDIRSYFINTVATPI